MSVTRFTRIENLLNYIHTNLHLGLSLDELAAQSCWSRWQLQRVFQAQTGYKVAQYVRVIKLSRAAELLLDTSQTVAQVSEALGFGSEISFNRAFRQHFACTPGVYRRKRRRQGIVLPLSRMESNEQHRSKLVNIRLERLDGLQLVAVDGVIDGLFAEQPEFAQQVPRLWEALLTSCPTSRQLRHIGVIDVPSLTQQQYRYFAGVEVSELPADAAIQGLTALSVPEQHYAVISHIGPVSELAGSLWWFLEQWLPDSGYQGLEGFELEIYPANYQADAVDALMEYWVPVVKLA